MEDVKISAERKPDGAGVPCSSPEATATLLWSACRPAPDEAASEAALARGADLAFASRVAVAQRLSPLLWQVAQRWASPADGWSASLRDDAQRCKAQALLVRPRVRSLLLEPLAAAGVQPLVIKGAAVAERYPGPGLRPMDDVDLLVPPEMHRDAAEALRRAGWETTRRQGPLYSLGLSHPGMPGLPVDLHKELAVRADQVFRLTAADLWEVARPVTLFGAPALALPPEMELVLIATHAGKPFHNFDRLLWAVDAAVIVLAAGSAGAPIDWGGVGEIAERAGARSALAVLLGQAERLGAASPPSLRQMDTGRTRRWALEAPLSTRWPLARLGEAERLRLTYAVIDDPWLRVRRLLYQTTVGGVVGAPLRGTVLVLRLVRRIWRVRRTTPGSRRHDWFVEDGDQQVDPVVADGEP